MKLIDTGLVIVGQRIFIEAHGDERRDLGVLQRFCRSLIEPARVQDWRYGLEVCKVRYMEVPGPATQSLSFKIGDTILKFELVDVGGVGEK